MTQQSKENTQQNTEEIYFLKTIEKILENGDTLPDRTNTGVVSIFGNELSFDLSNNVFPLLTTRRMNLRLIFEELMWFLRGQTDNQILVDKKVYIWKPNTTREFLDNRGLFDLPEGDIGCTYGFNYRHFGAEYKTCKESYSGQGVDQLMEVIRLLKDDPFNRRIMITLWDPASMHKASLPSCCFNFQFYVNSKKELTCKATQRSSDILLAGGWNIASGSLMTILLAKECGLVAKKFIWSTGNTHLYLNQLDEAKEQIKRIPFHFPTLVVKNEKNILDYEWEDFELKNYVSHPPIRIKMNA